MQIRFEMTGGVAGLYAARPLVWSVEVADLPDAERAALGTLLAKPASRAPAPHPDAFTYQLTITEADRVRTLVFDDASMPADARPLLQHLRQRATAERARATPPTP